MEENLYEIKDLILRKGTIIGEMIDVQEKVSKSNIIIPGKKDKPAEFITDYKDHLIQAKAIRIGEGIEEIIPGGINEGDIVFMLYPPNPNEIINLNGDMYVRIPKENIIAVRRGIKIDKSKSKIFN